ncbi:propanediol utilization protein [Rhodobium orientis]|uniref:Phosphate propanoyltransferase n=1 Tax=Rhodobium orientis TaxID=34017 RepID=A0A327JG13_9HYPH|nr:phosphate propanoyltransferase [Rhodobium orientis]MBB4301445.1 propanediol utilization protein [Rhodobium orientis]MBK5950968.1 phosphate propanoyltransferase [Rhodobium orientis]RAI25065.1 phosphate propanoyltransferase [Rhodobium orientis]
MQLAESTVERIIAEILAQGQAAAEAVARARPATDPALIPVGVSNRHIHLSRPDMDALFGPGAALTRKKAMKQPGQYAAEETVILRGSKGEIGKVRVLGPLRAETQVEISVADGFVLGVRAPLRLSGRLDGSPGIEVIGPQGSVIKDYGVIVALRHIHMPPEVASGLGLVNGEQIDVEVDGPRGGIMRGVAVRAAENSALEMHIDIEEANAFGLKNDDLVRIRKA